MQSNKHNIENCIICGTSKYLTKISFSGKHIVVCSLLAGGCGSHSGYQKNLVSALKSWNASNVFDISSYEEEANARPIDPLALEPMIIENS